MAKYAPKDKLKESLFESPISFPKSTNAPIPHCIKDAPIKMAILKLVDTLPENDFGKLEITRL